MPSKKNKSAKKTKQQRNRSNAIGQHLILPPDVIGVIAKFLQQDLQLKTLANLNVASHVVHEETLPTLYKLVIHRYNKANQADQWHRLKRSSGAHYIRFFVEVDEGLKDDPARCSPDRPLHDFQDAPHVPIKASVSISPHGESDMNIMMVFIWPKYQYGSQDLPMLLQSLGLVYNLNKMKRNPSGKVGRLNRVIVMVEPYSVGCSFAQAAPSIQFPNAELPMIIDEVDLFENPSSCPHHASEVLAITIIEFTTLIRTSSSEARRKRQRLPIFIMWPTNKGELLQTCGGISLAYQRNPCIVDLTLYVYCPIPFDIGELRIAYDVVLEDFNRASNVIGRAAEESIKILPPNDDARDWYSALNICGHSAKHFHITFHDGVDPRITRDTIERREDGIIVRRGEIGVDPHA